MSAELTTEFEIDLAGMTVPYSPLFDSIRRNHGFEDVRGRPERAAEIPEGEKSGALRELLVALAAPGSPLFTLGCDLGKTREPYSDGKWHYLAGGYVQVISANYVNRHPDEYYRFAKAIAEAMKAAIARHSWRLRFVMTPACVNLDGNSNVEPSLWLWFDAVARKPKFAVASREDLLIGLLTALRNPVVLAKLEPETRLRHTISRQSSEGILAQRR